MSRLNLVLADQNTRYMSNLATFILANYRHRFNVQTYTDPDSLYTSFADIQNKTDILLLSEDWYKEWVNRPDGFMMMILGGGTEDNGIGDGKAVVLNRYSGADSLIGEILKIYAQREGIQDDAEAVRGKHENRVTVLFAPCGGAGRTTIAIGLSTLYARIKYQTLYLNFDWHGVEEFAFEPADPVGLSEIIFSLKSRPEKLGLKLEALKQTHREGQFFYYPPPQYPLDLDEVKVGELESLINKIRMLGVFDRVLIDAHSGLSEKNKMLLELADSIYMVAECSPVGVQKLLAEKKKIDKVFLEQAQYIYKRSTILLNKADESNQMLIDTCVRQVEEAFRAKVGVLPYCGVVAEDYSAGGIANLKHGLGRAIADLVNARDG